MATSHTETDAGLQTGPAGPASRPRPAHLLGSPPGFGRGNGGGGEAKNKENPVFMARETEALGQGRRVRAVRPDSPLFSPAEPGPPRRQRRALRGVSLRRPRRARNWGAAG